MTPPTPTTIPDIELLPPNLINKIAAGEVVERPASVVKELVENALDAGATKIDITATEGGKSLRIADNGHGMTPENAQRAFINHATSKIKTDKDLEAIASMGFRGEALASISSVSQFTCTTRPHDAELGTKIIIQQDADLPGGELLITPTGCGAGTVMTIDDLFYTTPARLKFLKKDSTELAHIDDTVKRLALANPKVQFSLTMNKKTTLTTDGQGDVKATLKQVLKLSDIDANFVPIDLEDAEHGARITGISSTPNLVKNSRQQCYIFVNRRPIKCPIIHKAIDAAYQGMIHPGKQPVSALFIELPASDVDVNVHPTKREVRYVKPNIIFSLVKYGILNALEARGVSKILPNQSPSHPSILPSHSPTGQAWPASNGYLTPSTSFGQRSFSSTPTPLAIQHSHNLFSPLIKPNTLSHDETDQPPAKTLRVIGQLFNTYILLESAQGLMVIDQHIASERTLFEQFKRHEEHTENPSQALFTPITLDITAEQHEQLTKHQSTFNTLGFSYQLDENHIKLTAIPAVYLEKHNPTEWLMDALQQVSNSPQAELNVDDVLATMSCHRAVRAGDKLTYDEMTVIIDRWLACTLPWTCPHGRPIAHTIETGDLNKLFDRPSLPTNAFA